ncbi:MAG: DUF2635 domain-containing protein [Gallionella sp.]|nr:DUF2635 domain-containing protein [Gallionella sp.]
MFVKPADGLRIVDPDLNGFLPAEGREVPDSDYWHRLWLAGDVVKADAPQPAVPPSQSIRSFAAKSDDTTD